MSPNRAEMKEDFPQPTRPTRHESSPFRAEKLMLCSTVGACCADDHLNVPLRIRTVSSSMYCTAGSRLTASV